MNATLLQFVCGCVFGTQDALSDAQHKTLRCPLHHRGVQVDEFACCRKRVPSPFNRRDGETWTCPQCSREFVYVEDEGEGGSWVPR